jgi:protein phosphatase
LVDGVRYLHRARIVHSDLKPENLIVLPDGQIRIIDLGRIDNKFYLFEYFFI